MKDKVIRATAKDGMVRILGGITMMELAFMNVHL